jgi:hypothetical protein
LIEIWACSEFCVRCLGTALLSLGCRMPKYQAMATKMKNNEVGLGSYLSRSTSQLQRMQS